jgi:hypothetical protein
MRGRLPGAPGDSVSLTAAVVYFVMRRSFIRRLGVTGDCDRPEVIEALSLRWHQP